MSKTLFNQNTFQQKNVTNSDDVSELKVDTLRSINLTATNIINNELQAATSGVSANAQSLVNKQDKFTASNLLNPNFISADNDGSAVTITTGQLGALTGFDNTGGATIQGEINKKQIILSASNLLNPNFISAVNDGDSVTITTGQLGALTGFDNTGGATIQGEINKKALLYDVTTPLVKTTRSSVGLGENPILLSINKTTSASSGSTDLITSGGVFTGLSGKQATLTEGAGIDITGSTIKLDLSTVSTSAPQTLPTGLEIITNQDTGLLVTATDNTGQSARVIIRGRRPSAGGGTSENHAELQFKNNDRDLSSPNDENILGSIVGRVSNATTNIGGILLNNFTDGQTQTTALNMSSEGNFAFGDNATFQNTYKLKNSGSTNLSGLNYIKPNMVLMGFDKDNIISSSGNVWGNGSRQTAPRNKREIGESFSSENDGIITFTKSGYYRIHVSANSQSEQYNDRLAFMNYLTINSTSYNENEHYNFFGWGYIRNTSDGGHTSCSFEDYIFINANDTLQVNQKLDINNLNFDDTLPASNIDQFLNLHIERIYDSDLGS